MDAETIPPIFWCESAKLHPWGSAALVLEQTAWKELSAAWGQARTAALEERQGDSARECEDLKYFLTLNPTVSDLEFSMLRTY